MQLVRKMTYRVHADQPLEPTAGSPEGAVQHWRIAEASLHGPRIHATLAGTGTDWMRVGDDGFWRPHVRLQFVTDDDAVILMEYTGLVEQTPAFTAAAEADAETGWDDQYLRLAVRFSTGSADHSWLNTSVFVAAGRLLGTGRIEYHVYRVT